MTTLSYQNCSMVGAPFELQEGVYSSSALESKAFTLIEQKCVSCHNPDNPSGGIDYLTDLDALLYYRLVVPKEPQLSTLYSVIANGQMPPNEPLTNAEVEVINDWILNGIVEDADGITPPTPNPVTLGPSYTAIRSLILQPKCLGCHNATNSAGGVNYATYQGVLNTVQPGNLNASSLYTTTLSGSMPRSGTRLTTAEMNAIRGWIEAGAPQN